MALKCHICGIAFQTTIWYANGLKWLNNNKSKVQSKARCDTHIYLIQIVVKVSIAGTEVASQQCGVRSKHGRYVYVASPGNIKYIENK